MSGGSIFEQLKRGLSKTRVQLMSFLNRGETQQELLEELESALIQADVGSKLTSYLIEQVRARTRGGKAELLAELKSQLISKLDGDSAIKLNASGPTVILVVGVNGTGKTTTIGKLAYMFKNKGAYVILGAADTFRAAAVDQLEVWARRAGVDLVRHQEGSDPAAVAYDAVSAALARKCNIVIIDTAGRLHTKSNLMDELKKLKRVVARVIPDAPHETLLVLDATTGQNGLQQARLFKEAVDVTGVVLTKLDGTAKGGIVLAIMQELGVPVKFVGIGEGIEDIQPFDGKQFVEALLA